MGWRYENCAPEARIENQSHTYGHNQRKIAKVGSGWKAKEGYFGVAASLAETAVMTLGNVYIRCPT